MLFSRDKDDDEDFVPNANYQSNLASIFGSTGNDCNPSLTYTAPKQPKRQSKTTSSATASSAVSSTSVVVAKTVQTFKMIDGAYQNQGRVGAAVISISTEESNIYQLLLYRDKRHHLCSAKITRDFNFHIQPKNYCTFYDKQSIIWSILFDSSVELVGFTMQVAIAKWKSEESTSPIMIQDLWCPVSDDPKAPAVAVGDGVELTYSLQPLSSMSQGLEEVLSVSVVVEGAGWKQGLLGAQPTTQRVIILQPFMLGDLNPKEIVYNSPVVVKLTVVQINKVHNTSLPSDPPKEELKDIKKELFKPHSTDVEGSPRTSPKPTKADLITRMARMGQALPFKTAAPTPSDSDEPEEDQNSHLLSQDRVVPKPRSRVQHSVALPPAPFSPIVGGATSLSPSISTTQHQLPVQWSPAPYLVGNMYSAPQLQSPLDSQSQFNMFFSEVRTTNSELRMGITRLTDKVEALQSKIGDSGRRSDHETTSVLERLLESEQQLRNQLQMVLSALPNNQPHSHSRIDSQPSASLSSAEPCQRCVDLEQARATLNANINKLKEENEHLQTCTAAQKDALQNAKIADRDQLALIETLQKQLEAEQTSVSELNQKLESVAKEKEDLVLDLRKANDSITGLQNTLLEKQTSIDKLEQALKDSEATKIEEVRRNLQEVLYPKPVIGEHIKKILNAVYRLVKVQFEPQNKYDAAFIQSVLAETIKAVTLEYIQNGDLILAELWQSSRQGTTTHFGVEQTRSAPVISSKQAKGVHVPPMRKEHHRSGAVEVMVSATDCTEVPSEGEFSTPQETSTSSLDTEATSTQNNEDSAMKDVAVTNQNEVDSERESSRLPAVEPKPSFPDSAEDSSDDVWRPKPPTPPLFDDEENDDWLNT